MPSVTIVVPVLNETATIEAALHRLCTDFADCELVVVDGGSSDATVAIAESLATVLHSPVGRARQMNTGARQTTGDVLWFVHADVTVAPEALLQLRAALADPAVVGGGLTLRFDVDSPSLNFLARTSTMRARRLRQIYGDQSMFVRRETFERLGGFPDLPLMEDLDFSRLLRAAGPTVVLSATSTASARRLTRHGTVRMIAFMQYLKLRYRAGASSERIRLRYEAGPGLRLPRTGATKRAGAR